MKTAKRILAVLILIVVALAIGYLVFTGSRLGAMQRVYVFDKNDILDKEEILTALNELRKMLDFR